MALTFLFITAAAVAVSSRKDRVRTVRALRVGDRSLLGLAAARQPYSASGALRS